MILRICYLCYFFISFSTPIYIIEPFLIFLLFIIDFFFSLIPINKVVSSFSLPLYPFPNVLFLLVYLSLPPFPQYFFHLFFLYFFLGFVNLFFYYTEDVIYLYLKIILNLYNTMFFHISLLLYSLF